MSGEYFLGKIFCNIREINDTVYREQASKSYSYRKVRLADDHSSKIFLTLWNKDTSTIENLGLTVNMWVSIRNFKTNDYKGERGLFLTKKGEIQTVLENDISPSLRLNINRDWESTKNIVVVGVIEEITDIFTNKVERNIRLLTIIILYYILSEVYFYRQRDFL